MQVADSFKTRFDLRLKKILSIHFDPLTGSKYWIERARNLGIDVLREIHTEQDLYRFGVMPLDDLAKYPVESFIPKRFLDEKRSYVIASTGGRTGKPKTTAYFRDEFESVFVDNFVQSAVKAGFPKGSNWLWIGPGGPHIIGRAAYAIATEMSGHEPFSVDFDPRWFRKLAEGSMARRRYMEHLLEQAYAVIESQRIDVLFTTPVVLRFLTKIMIRQDREAIRGIYLGGMSITLDDRSFFLREFPNAVMMAGYGNTLLGVCDTDVSLNSLNDEPVRYKVPSERIFIKMIHGSEAGDLRNTVKEGERGRLTVHRIDESVFLPNVIESDTAVRLPDGYLGDPQPFINQAHKISVGIY